MDINKVTFGNYSIGAKQGNVQKETGKEEAPKANVAESNEKSIDKEAFLNAMDIAGMQNKIQIAKTEKKAVNPADFLNEDRISDIEAMMGKFEDGVNSVANAIEAEFPGFFAEDTKNALAAKIFAQE